MPTYADQWNEQQRALGRSGPSNPVRLTISKGDYEWDPHLNRFCYVEQWEEEHLMEDEELHDANYLAAVSSAVDGHGSRGSSPSLPATLQNPVLSSSLDGMRTSLWVLDTNTLLSCLDLLKALFASLLTRNVAYAAAFKQGHLHTRPSSIRLILPYVVVSELDGLKISKGRSVSSQARNANHWLLSALQKQKRVPIDEAGANLSEDLWPLFVQPSSHYNASKGSRGTCRWDLNDFSTADDEIVKFCVDLSQQTSSMIRFCSDDTNARTKAELDGIDSFAMREFANALKDNFKNVRPEDKWTYVADEIIDQWEFIGLNA
uniref:PIN domain-containing protein n=1 Tax=Kalmanozyma brasiliensis (strain GHG001) TaxID=1365824 RepID=V5GI51_KALBG